MRDTYRGERVIKDAGTRYLPPTAGMILDGMDTGQRRRQAFNAYKTRARFPSFVSQAIQSMIGVMHHKPPTIELPARLEPIRENSTVRGESLGMLLRRINEEQLITGRVGIMADVRNGAPAGVLPHVATYRAESIINWDDGEREELRQQVLNLVILDESEFVRTHDFDWEHQQQYRVLILGDTRANEAVGPYRMGVFEDTQATFNESQLIEPSIAGRTLDKIPFVFINPSDIVTTPDDPPLMGLARLALGVYRGEADYRQGLFLQGQDTLVIIGDTSDEDIRAGAGATVRLGQGGDAKYIGVSSDGLEEQRLAIQNDEKNAAELGGKMLDNRGGGAESGEALRIRVAARTSTLHQIALAGAEGLQQLLRIMAEWVGSDPEQVVVTPNLDFAEGSLEGKTLVDFMAAKTMGAPLSNRSIHRLLQERDVTELNFEEELEQIASEGGEELPLSPDGL